MRCSEGVRFKSDRNMHTAYGTISEEKISIDSKTKAKPTEKDKKENSKTTKRKTRNVLKKKHSPVLLALPSVDLQQCPDALAYPTTPLSPNGAARTVRQQVLDKRENTQAGKTTYIHAATAAEARW